MLGRCARQRIEWMGADLKRTSLDPAWLMGMWSARSVVELSRRWCVSGSAGSKMYELCTRERCPQKQSRTDVMISRNNKSESGKGEV